MTPISNSQKRLLNLLNLPVADDYASAGQALGREGYRPDAIPAGGTWRTAKKLSDAELLAATRVDFASMADSAIDRY